MSEGQTGSADVPSLSPIREWWCQRFQKASPSLEGGRSGEGNGLVKMMCFPLHMQMV